MAYRKYRSRFTYAADGTDVQLAPLVIQATRNPTTNDFAEIGTTWVNKSTAAVYVLAKIAAGSATWSTSPGSGVGTFTSVDVTTGDLDVQAAGSTTTISSGTVNFDNGAGAVTMSGDLTVAGTTTLNGDIDITSASVFDITVTCDPDPAILLQTNGGTSETIQLINTQGTASDAIELRAVAGEILVNTTNSTDAASIALTSNAGGIELDAALNAANAISLDASDAAGGITMAAGTGGILIGNQADCTTIDVGDFAPTANRTITVGGGTVVTAAVTDTIDIGPDGATTNANSIKTVNVNTGGVTLGEVLTNVATGAITSGTHTVSIQTGNAAAGTVATNISTGTGTKTVKLW